MNSTQHFSDLYSRFAPQMEDFWDRRANQSQFTRQLQFFDRWVVFDSNLEGILTAGEISRNLFSQAPLDESAPPFHIQIIVHPAPSPPGAAPQNLFDYIHYTGADNWLMLHLAQWGHCYVDLSAGRAVAVLTPELAAEPEVVSRCLLNTVITNFFLRDGYSLLHATGLLKDGRLLLLMAPHNTGKSTTALRLITAGYTLLSDSQIYVRRRADGLQLTAFPVGRIKLRHDMVPTFPALHPYLDLEYVQVRGETKHVLDLRKIPALTACTTSITIKTVDFCLLTRHAAPHTDLRPATPEAMLSALMVNSLHYDTHAVWRGNLAPLADLVQQAQLFHLTIGTEIAGILGTVAELAK